MGQFLENYFFNSTYALPGAALIASPIIIHLINRMRYRRVQFAAMEFLLASDKRNRQRIMFEQLLLLLLRILIVLLIVMLISRLILSAEQLSLFGDAKTHHLVIVDDSGSMRDRVDGQNAFQTALTVVRKIANEGSRRSGTPKLSIIRMSRPENPIISQRTVDEVLLSELATKFENASCSHQSVDLVKCLEVSKTLLGAQRTDIKHLHLISDFRLRDWQDQNALHGVLKGLATANVSINFVKTTTVRNRNLAIVDLTGDLQVAAVGVPVHMTLKVKNFGEKVEVNQRVTVWKDGQKLPLTIKFDKIEVGEVVEREFDVQFDTPKKHELHVELDSDPLSEDNSRFLVVDITLVNKVLIIDGVPGEDEGSYLADALAADPSLTGFAPQIEDVDFLYRRPLDEFQSIFMLNVAEIPKDAVAPLEAYVAAGGGLAWYLGDTVKASFYNSSLFKDGGKGLFPVELANAPRTLAPDDSANPGSDLVLGNKPMFRVFEGQENPYLDVARVYEYFPVSDDWVLDDQKREDDVETVAFLRTRHPLMFMHKLGAGRIFTCLTSCGPSWNNWCYYASYVVLELELQKSIARTDLIVQQRIVGEPIRESLDPVEFQETVEITSPNSPGNVPIRLKASPEKVEDGQSSTEARSTTSNADASRSYRLLTTFRDTDHPGVYKVQLVDQQQIPLQKWFAYNFPLEESNLELATTAQIRKQIGTDVDVEIHDADSFSWSGGKNADDEVREWLLILLLACMVGEQLLAYRLGFHRAAKPAVSSSTIK